MSINFSTLNHFVLLDDISKGAATLLSDLYSHLRFNSNDLARLDNALAEGWKQGLFSFVYIPYEFGLGLVNEQVRAQHDLDDNNQIHIFWFQQKKSLSDAEITEFLGSFSTEVAGVAEATFSISAADYEQKIAAVHRAISRGDVYQINYTASLDFKSYGHPAALYRRLRERQQVPFAALANLPLEQKPWLLSLSPELFLDIQAEGLVKAKPMKGTAPILNDGEDERRAIDLQQDLKNRAENLMIVDLLRNDLGRIAEIGQVKVPALFDVNRFGSVWQMTSTVEAQVPSNLSFSTLLNATFPCGSITGAPKKMSMQIIEELEQRTRGIYTGSIGLIEANSNSAKPGALAFHGQLNVMIRSFHLQEVEDYYLASMGVGSGIVIDSKASDEYDECFWKARFLLGLSPEFAIFETMRWEEGSCVLLAAHKARLLASAVALAYPLLQSELEQGFTCLFDKLATKGLYRLKITLESAVKPFRAVENNVSIELNPHLRLVATIFDLAELSTEQTVLVSKTSTFRPTYLSRYKTDQRSSYDVALAEALKHGAFDQLLFDQEGRLLEGARSNVFLKIKGTWYTPSSGLAILNGVMRQEILAHPISYLNTEKVIETQLTRDDVFSAEEIVLTNALRGLLWVKVRIL